MSEKHCTSPMTSPSRRVTPPSPRCMPAPLEQVVAALGDPHDPAPEDQRDRDHPQAAQRAGDEVLGRAGRPPPPGTEPMMTAQASR